MVEEHRSPQTIGSRSSIDNEHSWSRLHLLAACSALTSVIIGAIVIVGWTLDAITLTQFFMGRSAMQPVTAVCAVLTGASVLSASRRAIGIASALALCVTIIAIQTLVQHAFAVDLGTDKLLFPRAVAAQPAFYSFPGRMAEPTAVSFLLIAVAQLLAARHGRRSSLLLTACTTIVLMLVTIALASHLFVVAPLTGILGFTQVAVPTALALGASAIGVLALRPSEGWLGLLVGESVAATAARWLVPGVVIVPTVVAWLAARGSAAGVFPNDFRLAFTTALTVILLVTLALWGSRQLDKLVSVRRVTETLRESEATLRAFFETEGLLASIVEVRGGDARYLSANRALSRLYGREDVSGLAVREVQPPDDASAFLQRVKQAQASGLPTSLERSIEASNGVRWFIETISPIAGSPVDAPRFTTAALDITERKRAEAQQQLLLLELNHRVKNTLAVVQSLALQTFRGDQATPAARRAFDARLAAVAAAHHQLVRQDWRAASIGVLVGDVVGPGCGTTFDRFDIAGPDVMLPPRTSVSLALALHELCTNAVKYGALSNDSGRVAVSWSIVGEAPGRLRLIWQESGGPPVSAPSARGFGSRLIERALAAELEAPVELIFLPGGVRCVVETIFAEASADAA
ncbi:PAS domain S-box protein [Sphingomonas sp. RRHST34]|uniref:histidine kinase n=1 Tax=Sphingomonas citri TaxID=2862499 RepID=A0ABS7BLK5_9SPHN|nr:HWE histidine kinase domain-containing protein [Sphingomonas citri]MBW6530408.1 PAS domain S-box protein [Sphingomonas citri]